MQLYPDIYKIIIENADLSTTYNLSKCNSYFHRLCENRLRIYQEDKQHYINEILRYLSITYNYLNGSFNHSFTIRPDINKVSTREILDKLCLWFDPYYETIIGANTVVCIGSNIISGFPNKYRVYINISEICPINAESHIKSATHLCSVKLVGDAEPLKWDIKRTFEDNNWDEFKPLIQILGLAWHYNYILYDSSLEYKNPLSGQKTLITKEVSIKRKIL